MTLWKAAAPLALLAMTGLPASAGAADACTNASFRTGASAGLSDCRAWEQVTPADKHGHSASIGGGPGGSSLLAAGGGLSFVATAPFDDASAAAAPSNVVYAARRAASGWTARDLSVPDSRGHNTPLSAQVQALSSDQTSAIVYSRRALAAGAIEGGFNQYLEDTSTGALTLLAASRSIALEDATFVGSSDFSTVFFITSADVLDPENPDAGSSTLYRFSGGRLQRVPGASTAGFLDFQINPAFPPVSKDGSRATIIVDGQSIILVDGLTRRIVSHPAGQPDVVANGTSPITTNDATRVTYASNEALTPESTPDGSHVYRWSAQTNANEDLLAGATAGGAPLAASLPALSVVGASDDGRFVYFQSFGGGPVVDGGPDTGGLFVLDTTTRNVTALTDSPVEDQRFSPSGNAAAFTVRDEDNIRQVYAYDATPPETSDSPNQGAGPFCVTCRAVVPTNVLNQNNTELAPGRGVTSVLDDGRIFFNTPAQLDPADLDATNDAYEFDTYGFQGSGRARLLTTANGEGPSRLVGFSRDLTDLVVYTAGALVPSDTDGVVDVYDARIGGGLAAQQTAPAAPQTCVDDGCQPPPSASPAAATAPPSAGPAPVTPAAAPAFGVTTPSASARRSAAKTGRLRVAVRVGTGGTVAGALQASLGGKTRTVASQTVKATGARTLTLSLRLSKTARRKLARSGRLTLRLTVRYSRRTAPIRKTIRLTSSKKKGARR